MTTFSLPGVDEVARLRRDLAAVQAENVAIRRSVLELAEDKSVLTECLEAATEKVRRLKQENASLAMRVQELEGS